MTRDIMDSDLKIVIQKSKAKYRNEKKFYILKYGSIFFGTRYPDGYPKDNIYYQYWLFDESIKKWVQQK